MSQTTVQLALGKQKIIEDIKVLLNDAEELLRLSATLPGEGVDALRSRLRDPSIRRAARSKMHRRVRKADTAQASIAPRNT